MQNILLKLNGVVSREAERNEFLNRPSLIGDRDACLKGGLTKLVDHSVRLARRARESRQGDL